MSKQKKIKLIPPDKKQCQALKPNGCTFMSLGGVPGLVRCKSKPTVIIKETANGKDGQRGSMSLCDECLAVAVKQLGGIAFTTKPIGKAKMSKP